MTGHPELVEGCRNICANNYAIMYRGLATLEGNSRIFFLKGFIQLGKKGLLADFSPNLKYLILGKEGSMFSYPTKAGSKAALHFFYAELDYSFSEKLVSSLDAPLMQSTIAI